MRINKANKATGTTPETKNLVNAGIGVTVDIDWVKAAVAVTVAAIVIMAVSFTFQILKKRL